MADSNDMTGEQRHESLRPSRAPRNWADENDPSLDQLREDAAGYSEKLALLDKLERNREEYHRRVRAYRERSPMGNNNVSERSSVRPRSRSRSPQGRFTDDISAQIHAAKAQLGTFDSSHIHERPAFDAPPRVSRNLMDRVSVPFAKVHGIDASIYAPRAPASNGRNTFEYVAPAESVAGSRYSRSEFGDAGEKCRICKRNAHYTKANTPKRCPNRCPCNIPSAEDHMRKDCQEMCELTVCQPHRPHKAVNCKTQCHMCALWGDLKNDQGQIVAARHCAKECIAKVCPFCEIPGHWGVHCEAECKGCGDLQCIIHCAVCGQPGRAGLDKHNHHSWAQYIDQFYCEVCETEYWAGFSCRCPNSGKPHSDDDDARFRRAGLRPKFKFEAMRAAPKPKVPLLQNRGARNQMTAENANQMHLDTEETSRLIPKNGSRKRQRRTKKVRICGICSSKDHSFTDCPQKDNQDGDLDMVGDINHDDYQDEDVSGPESDSETREIKTGMWR